MNNIEKHLEKIKTYLFDKETERKLIRIFSTLRRPFNKLDFEEYLEKRLYFVHNNEFLIEAKTRRAKKVICSFIDKDELKVKEIKYNKKCDNLTISSKYLKKAINLLGYDDLIKIKAENGKPITLENTDFKIIIAPIIENTPELKEGKRKNENK